VAPFELLVTVSFCVMVSFLYARAFYTKFEAWSVPLYIDTMGFAHGRTYNGHLRLASFSQALRQGLNARVIAQSDKGGHE